MSDCTPRSYTPDEFPLAARAAAILALLMVLLTLAGCGRSGPPPSAPTPTRSAGEALPIEAITRGGVGCVPVDTDVRVFFVTDPEQIDAMFRAIFGTNTNYQVTRAIYEELNRTDFSTHALLALQWQCEPDIGHDVVIKDVLLQGDGTISVYAELWEPWAAAPATSGSQHIVRIPWTSPAEPTIDLVGYHLNGRPPGDPKSLDSSNRGPFESPLDHVSVMVGSDITDPGPRTYTSEEAGYSIDYPVGWNVIERNEGKAGSVSFDGPHGDSVSVQYVRLEKPEDENLIEWLKRVGATGPGPGTPKGYTPVELDIEGARGESQQAEMIYTIRARGYGFFITNGRLVLEVFTHSQNDSSRPSAHMMANSVVFAEDAPSSLSELQPPDEELRYSTLEEYYAFLDSFPHVRPVAGDGSTWIPDSPLSPGNDAAEVLPTSTPSTPASSIPPQSRTIPAEQRDWFVYRGISHSGPEYPDWEIRYDPEMWDLRFTENGTIHSLVYRDIPACSIELHAHSSGKKVLARTYLAGKEWETSEYRESIVNYSIWYGDTGYFFDLSLPEVFSSAHKSQCQIDAETVFATFSEVQKRHDAPLYDSQGRRRVVIDSAGGAEYPPFEVWYDETLWEFQDRTSPRGRGGVLVSPTDSWCRLELYGSRSSDSFDTTTIANREWELLSGEEPSTIRYGYGNGELSYTMLANFLKGETYRSTDKGLCQQQIEDVLATFKILY